MTLSSDLLAWYDREKRALPWRDAVTPYRTWVSEIMLQQTRVDTVIRYYERFMAAFPDVEALAAAPLDEVLTLWAGLGYYSRARNLHAAARAVVARGGFPDTAVGLRSLPGIGSYTAGAIASIALGQDEPAVDGNVERVLSRVLRSSPGRRTLESTARSFLPAGRAGDFNQALMDLGSAVCLPTGPLCGTCPIAAHCGAHRAGDPGRFPARKEKRSVPRIAQVALVWARDDRVLFARLPEEGLFGGLYELPTADLRAGEEPGEGAWRVAREQLALTLEPAAVHQPVLHVLTHRRLSVTPVAVVGPGEPASDRYTAFAWWAPSDAKQISTLTKKVLARLS